MVFAWKNAQRLDASMLEARAAVCAPLPSVSAKARSSASTEMSSATRLLPP